MGGRHLLQPPVPIAEHLQGRFAMDQRVGAGMAAGVLVTIKVVLEHLVVAADQGGLLSLRLCHRLS